MIEVRIINSYYSNICIIKLTKMKFKPKKKVMEISSTMKSLSHPARVEIVLMLNKDKSVRFCVNDILKKLGLSQPETSRHLSVMRQCEVVTREKSGVVSYYSLNLKNTMVNCISTCFK